MELVLYVSDEAARAANVLVRYQNRVIFCVTCFRMPLMLHRQPKTAKFKDHLSSVVGNQLFCPVHLSQRFVYFSHHRRARQRFVDREIGKHVCQQKHGVLQGRPGGPWPIQNFGWIGHSAFCPASN